MKPTACGDRRQVQRRGETIGELAALFARLDTVAYSEVAATLEAVLGRPFTRTEWTVPQLKPELAEDPDNHIKKYRAVFAEGRGVA